LISFDGALRGSASQVTAAVTGTGAAAALTLTQVGGVGSTTVATGAALELAGGLTYSGEFISSLSGAGFNNLPPGALRLIDSDPNSAETTTWNGNVALGAASVVAVAGAADALIIGGSGQAQGQITGNQTFTKYGPGTLELGGVAPNTNAAAVVVNEG